jgi:predicted amidohydrolase YtcJ
MWMRRSLVVLAATLLAGGVQAQDAPVTVWVADEIVTMEPAFPEAKAVAVRDGRILGVGRSVDDLAAWLEGTAHRVDRRFEEKVLMPGFIDPHLHPMMAAVLLPTHFITPEDWQLPRGKRPGVRTPEAYRARLASALAAAPGDGPFVTWGYHALWHGPLDRTALDALQAARPVIVWHRSFHEIIVNTQALELLGFANEATLAEALQVPGIDPSHADWATGHFAETALAAALPRLQPVVLAPEHLAQGFQSLRQMMLAAGVTTIADMATGLFADLETEATLIQQAFESAGAPARVLLVPAAATLIRRQGSAQAALEYLAEARARWAGDRVFLRDRVKLLADGAFFSQLMRLNPPGYTDGHQGKWITEPEDLEAMARTFWNAGYTLHCHVNGDEGLDVVLDVLEQLLTEAPRPDHRFTLEHVGYSTEVQSRRIRSLGALVSAQPNYLYMLGVKYGERGLGRDRAAQISRLGSFERHGTTVALHSDATMAPVDPLFLAWIAANRETMEGEVLAPEERLSLDTALRAITIDAAFVLGLEDEIGSIAPGKRADFAVLEADPRAEGAARLNEIGIWGVVFEGKPFPRDGS